ncbi:MAG: SOS response-associated peptidase [Elusimicrobia bacterium]|nr:SOS response-associated peptidase [Elusimicrobiota bacterium]
MCGRYSQTADIEELADHFCFEDEKINFKPRYNIAPGQEAPIVIWEEIKLCKHTRWGLVPFWAREEAVGYKMINARAETLTQKSTFKKSFERKRCLVLADGFYEWRKIDGIKRKIPMRIMLKNKEPFAFAGLWDVWKKPDGSELRSFTIITTEPNDFMRPIHNRMPVILRQKDEEMWLDPDLKDTSKLLPLLAPYSSKEMGAYEVSTIVNSPQNDDPQCIVPVKV